MFFASRLKRSCFDTYMLLLAGTIALAWVLPASGIGAEIVSRIAYFAVALLFFIYGAKLDTASVVAGLANWRLQALVFGTTYLLFPLFGLGLSMALTPWLDPLIALGLLFLAVLPSTVQSSIAFTSMAQGNVPAAVCAASLSNLAGSSSRQRSRRCCFTPAASAFASMPSSVSPFTSCCHSWRASCCGAGSALESHATARSPCLSIAAQSCC